MEKNYSNKKQEGEKMKRRVILICLQGWSFWD